MRDQVRDADRNDRFAVVEHQRRRQRVWELGRRSLLAADFTTRSPLRWRGGQQTGRWISLQLLRTE